MYANYGDYFWEGQIDHCLKNKLGLTDPTILEKEERMLSAKRMAQLVNNPDLIEKTYDFEHLKNIHHYLFQDVYDWAGQIRVCDLVRPWKNGEGQSQFVNEQNIKDSAQQLFTILNINTAGEQPYENQLDFLASLLGALNVIHPFREGNGRTTRLFIEQVAEKLDIEINWKIVAEEFNETMLQGFLGHKEAIVDMLQKTCKKQTHINLHTPKLNKKTGPTCQTAI